MSAALLPKVTSSLLISAASNNIAFLDQNHYPVVHPDQIQEYIWWILSNKAEGRLLGIDEGPHSLTEPSKEITSVGSGESSHIYAYKS